MWCILWVQTVIHTLPQPLQWRMQYHVILGRVITAPDCILLGKWAISSHISKWELVCKFGVIFHIFIISCLCSRFHVWNQWFFYSVITFSYTKYFVHSYTVDVVFTLSYSMRKYFNHQYHHNLNDITICFTVFVCLVFFVKIQYVNG